ncbi:recombinase family protein [Nonomuraea sp. KM90]|uniref:recombinase family protein n=1 Tax=Nonomuraea sp. KM90 TaxID=3457428 RepID=UPI003FCC6D4F
MGELIGHARCSTVAQDLTSQREILASLGVAEDRIYLDKDLTGTDRALAAVRSGGTLVTHGVRLSQGGSIYDPADPMSKMFFNMLAVFAEFEADLPRMRTREGMSIARSRSRLEGPAPELTTRQQAELVRMHSSGELMEVFAVGRATVYRVPDRVATAAAEGA